MGRRAWAKPQKRKLGGDTGPLKRFKPEKSVVDESESTSSGSDSTDPEIEELVGVGHIEFDPPPPPVKGEEHNGF